jgi:ferredoxin-type protein NapG
MKIPGGGDRRQFFRQAFGGALDRMARAAEDRIVQKRYVRPPGALPEMMFLAACTRCGLCAPACSPGAIRFAGPEGGLAAGTPFLEVERVPCVACSDIPCAVACPTDALLVTDRGWEGMHLGRITFHPNRCITFQGQACAICVQACPIGPKALELDDSGHPVLKFEGCVACGVCVRECPTLPSSFTFAPLER